MKNMQNSVNTKEQKERSKIIEEDVKRHMESIMQKELLTGYLEETQKELDAHFELLESKGKLPIMADCFEEGTQTQIEWAYHNDFYTFGLKQDYWLIDNGQYIAVGSETEMNELSFEQTGELEAITPKSVLLKRKQWILTQLLHLKN
jgi:hypothetical protein